jgi:exosortase
MTEKSKATPFSPFVYLLLITISAGVFYFSLLPYFWIQWTQVPLYSHGFLIPSISIYLIWRKRDHLKKIPPEGSLVGFFLCILFLSIGLLSNLLEIHATLAYSLIGLINAMVLFLLGWKFLRSLLFPINFLLFMVPVQQAIILPLSAWMKITSAKGATWLLDTLGFTVIRDGVHLFFGNDISLTVANPCSGIQSFMALTALGAVYAYIWEGSIPRKIILFLFVFPLVIAANSVRVTLLSIAAISFGVANILDTPLHHLMGVFVFAFAIFGLMGCGKMLQWKTFEQDIESP